MIEVEVQNETYQTEQRLRFSAVPRIGEGIRLQDPDGFWASYDVDDLWYQKAEYGDVWVPYLHVCMTPTEATATVPAQLPIGDTSFASERPVYGEEEFVSFTG